MKKNYDQYSFTLKEKLLLALEVVGINLAVNYIFYKSIYALPVLTPLSFFYIKYRKYNKIQKRKRNLHYQFKDALSSFSAGLQAGYSMEQAIPEVVRDLRQIYGPEQDIVKEFQYISNQLGMQVSLDKLFHDFGERSNIEDISNFAAIIKTVRKTGGDVGGILRKSARMLEDKIYVKKEIDTAIAGKKMEQILMSVMPIGIVLYMQVTSPGFLDVLYGSLPGALFMTGCLSVYLLAYWVGRRIMDIEV